MIVRQRALPAGGVALACVLLAWPGEARAETASPGPIAVVRLLDPGKGKQAVADFSKMIARYCATGDPDEPRPPGEHTLGLGYGWEARELDRVDWRKHSCPVAPYGVQAIASGSFSKVHVDEVVLAVTNRRWRDRPRGPGGTGPEGDTSLILVGRDDRYRIRHVMVNGEQFTNAVRLRVAGDRDVLFMCQRGGGPGDYDGHCGFFARGSFHAPGPTSPLAIDPYPHGNEKYAATNELSLYRTIECGPAQRVEIGKIEARGDQLIVQLVVETALNRSFNPDGGGPYCDTATHKRRRVFDIAYQLERGGFRRVTPIPPQVTKALNSG